MSNGRHAYGGWRRHRFVTAGGIGVLLVLGSVGIFGYGPALGRTVIGAAESGNVVVTTPGAVIDGRNVRGYIHVKADNVRITDTEVRYAGHHSIRIFDGADGTVIEDTTVRCEAAKTNGVVFGNYTARRVHVHGCRNGFMYGPEAPATIVDSTSNGRPIEVGGPSREQPAPSRSATPSPGASHTAPGPTPSPSGTKPPYNGWPGADDTGVPSGKTLRDSGSVTVTTAGKVLDGLDIKGCVDIKADDVVIRNTRITCDRTTFGIRVWDGATNLLVEDSELDGAGRLGTAICCGHYTLRRVDIHHVKDGPRLADKTRVYDSWIHHLSRLPDSHNDALQTTGARDIIVRHNTLEAYNADTKDPMNAAIMVGSTTAPEVRDMLVEDNLFTGGNYTINFRGDLSCGNVVFRDNVFVDNARYGAVAGNGNPGITWADSNVWFHNGEPVD